MIVAGRQTVRWTKRKIAVLKDERRRGHGGTRRSPKERLHGARRSRLRRMPAHKGENAVMIGKGVVDEIGMVAAAAAGPSGLLLLHLGALLAAFIFVENRTYTLIYLSSIVPGGCFVG